MESADDEATDARFLLIVPSVAVKAPRRVRPHLRELLRTDVYGVREDGSVSAAG